MWVFSLTGAAMVTFHPDVAVVLGHPGLRVQEWQADAAFSAQAGIVAAALLNGLFIKLVAQPVKNKQRSMTRVDMVG